MINCKAYADEILNGITGYGHLAVISVGYDPASASYIKGKEKDCEKVGFGFTHLAHPEDVDEATIIAAVMELNFRQEVTGIIVQLPLPKHLNAERICESIVPEKDVDGFRTDSPYKPCTPEGIVYLLENEIGCLRGLTATIIGRGKLVGTPLSRMLLDKDMTVCICHSKTPKKQICKLAKASQVVVVAAGKHIIQLPNIHPDTLVIDCGVNRDADGKLCGDVVFCNSDNITPIPGGVGLLTRAMLMKHVERRNRHADPHC